MLYKNLCTGDIFSYNSDANYSKLRDGGWYMRIRANGKTYDLSLRTGFSTKGHQEGHLTVYVQEPYKKA